MVTWLVLCTILMKNLKVPKWARFDADDDRTALIYIDHWLIDVLCHRMPIVWATEALTEFLEGLQGSGKFLFGSIVGGMAAFDFGGPVNKVASLFC